MVVFVVVRDGLSLDLQVDLLDALGGRPRDEGEGGFVLELLYSV